MSGYPTELAQYYRDRGYWIGQTHTDLLEDAAGADPAAVAVVDDRRSVSYGALLERSRDIAHGLVRSGLRRGDRAVVQMPNVSEYLEVVFALFDAGVVPVFALSSHGPSEIDDLVTRSRAAAFITVDEFAGVDYAATADLVAQSHPSVFVVVAELGTAADRPQDSARSAPGPSKSSLADLLSGAGSTSTGRSTAPSEIAFLQLSGGTTGAPKLIGRTHDDYLYSVRESAAICGLTGASVFGVVLPVSHNFTMSSPGVLGAIHARSTIVMIGAPDARTVFASVEKHGVTQLSAVPPLVAAWIDSPARSTHDLSSLAVLQVGGAKLSRSLAERVPAAFGVTLQQVFGMAEGLVNYTRLDDDFETIVGTQGRPISPDDEVRVVDADGAPVPDGTPGALQTRGPYTIPNYWEGQSPESFTDDGFYRTGDVVVRDERGYLRVVGRDKDQINRAGEKISPEEIENHLLAHDAVRDASVVGVEDDRLGERIVAYVIPSSTSGAAVPDAIGFRGYLRERGLARFKIPDDVLIVDEFPTTAVGKVSKKVQRTDAVPADAQSDADPRAAVLADLADKLALEPSALHGSIALADTGIDSLALMALLDKWRAQGAVGLDFEVIAQSETLDALVDTVLTARGEKG